MRLDPGEELLLQRRPGATALVGPVLALLVVVGAAGFLAARVPAGTAQGPLRLAVATGALLLLARLALAPFLRWWSTVLVLTDVRLSLRTGVLRRAARDVLLARVGDVTVVQTLAQRVRGCGTLVVVAGGAEPLLVDLPGIAGVRRAVQQQVARAGSDRRAAWEDA